MMLLLFEATLAGVIVISIGVANLEKRDGKFD